MFKNESWKKIQSLGLSGGTLVNFRLKQKDREIEGYSTLRVLPCLYHEKIKVTDSCPFLPRSRLLDFSVPEEVTVALSTHSGCKHSALEEDFCQPLPPPLHDWPSPGTPKGTWNSSITAPSVRLGYLTCPPDPELTPSPRHSVWIVWNCESYCFIFCLSNV